MRWRENRRRVRHRDEFNLQGNASPFWHDGTQGVPRRVLAAQRSAVPKWSGVLPFSMAPFRLSWGIAFDSLRPPR